jgi:integrase
VATKVATGQRPATGVSAPLRRTAHPGVYRRGGRFIAVYRRGGRQRKESAPSFAEARSLKRRREAEARAERAGVTLHEHALGWVESYAGTGRDTVSGHTRREYRRLLESFALAYFPPKLALSELDRESLEGFVTWLAHYRGERGRLADRSIRNTVVPLRLALREAEEGGLCESGLARALLLPRRRGGRGWDFEQGRVLTRPQLAALLAEIPAQWRDFFDLLAVTGLRVSEAIALRWEDLELGHPASLWVRRSIVDGVIGAPKSRFGRRLLPLEAELAGRLSRRRSERAREEDLIFCTCSGAPLNPNNIRARVLVPALGRAGVARVGFHAFRHTCASLLIERGLSPLRLQRWMGHHSAAYTLDVYGHLIDAELAPPLDLASELRRSP